jgi:hypothetical protein
VEHANTDYPRKRFPCTNRQNKKFKLTAAGIKVDLYSRRKPLGSETTKCPSLKVLQMAEKTL